ncbi:MAG: hypothetical protein LBQ21_00610 [Clostridiales Family XIII bacterium]|jgi:hypothetical protein|nr:hypothetical protein [Clostridiales Family XIII bacterium]
MGSSNAATAINDCDRENVVRVDDMMLKCVSVILETEANTVWSCRDMQAIGQPYYTLLIVTDREIARVLVSAFAASEKETGERAYLRSFLWGEDICYLFPYRRERRLADFAAGQITNPTISEEICVNILLACMESSLPYPLLFLEFEQELVHVEKDNSVYLTTDFDVSKLDASIDESDCVVRCARTMLDILNMNRKKRLKSRKLLSRKIERQAYARFSEVYHDIKLTVLAEKKMSILRRFFKFCGVHRDRIFRIILVLSVICFVLALVMLISYLIFGDFGLGKIFGHSLNTIGTERLNVK